MYGHYVLGGNLTAQHSYDFAQMLYSGSLGMVYSRVRPTRRGSNRNAINLRKLRQIFHKLKRLNPLLGRFELPEFSRELMQYHLVTNEKQFPGWNMNMLRDVSDVPSQAGLLSLNDLIVGENMIDKSKITFGNPCFLALCFPWIYTTATGHYSLWKSVSRPEEMAENEGGIAEATQKGETLRAYCKRCLNSFDRRWAEDSSFLFLALDSIERSVIHASNNFVVYTHGRTFTQKDVYNNSSRKHELRETSIVTPAVRSSYSYKRRNFFDLSAMFNAFGEPQIFFTITMDDYSDHVRRACGSKAPWEDPALYTFHFRRIWKEFFNHYILEVFSKMVGGIDRFSYVMETQQRGAPHSKMFIQNLKTNDD
jgi:hypothetical protein